MHNDNFTTCEFVVLVLRSVFNKSENEAMELMQKIHQTGIGLVGVYPYQIAESKIEKVLVWAQDYEFPLHCSMEPVQGEMT